MSEVEKAGTWVWNVYPKDSERHFKVTAGQMEVDGNGVHLCAGPGHCGGLIASFPLGTVVLREQVPVRPVPAASPASIEVVSGELARFDLSPRIEIGVINITASNLDGLAGELSAFVSLAGTRADIRI